MDALQSAAYGAQAGPARDTIVEDANSPHDYALSGDPVVQEDGNGNLVRMQGQDQPPVAPQQAALPESLQEMERKMVASHTRRMQELAEQKRALEASQARYEQLTQQQLQALQQGQTAQQPTTQNGGLWDTLPELLRQNLDPSSKTIMDTLEQGIAQRVAMAEQKIQQMVQHETGRANKQARMATLGLEMQGLGQEFSTTGTQVPPHVLNNMMTLINQQPDLTAKQALALASPEILEQHAMQCGRLSAIAEMKKTQEASALQRGGGNIDMNAELPPGSDLEKYFERYARQSGDPSVVRMLQRP